MKKKYYNLCFLLFISVHISFAQNEGGVGINILEPHKDAILHLESDSKGLLLPRLTTNQRNTIVNPPRGLTIFNITDSFTQYYNGECWLNDFEDQCTSCDFDFDLSKNRDTLDRLKSDTLKMRISVSQTGNPMKDVSLLIGNALPSGIEAIFSRNELQEGNVEIAFVAKGVSREGTYPVLFTSVCENKIKRKVFFLTITPCYYLPIQGARNRYNVAEQFYSTSNIPRNQPVCIISHVQSGTEVLSDTAGIPAYSTGSIPIGSRLIIVNDGFILGRGGDGGKAISTKSNGSGQDGGTALELLVDATLNNNGKIYAGGGGGNSLGAGIDTTFELPTPINIKGLPPTIVYRDKETGLICVPRSCCANGKLDVFGSCVLPCTPTPNCKPDTISKGTPDINIKGVRMALTIGAGGGGGAPAGQGGRPLGDIEGSFKFIPPLGFGAAYYDEGEDASQGQFSVAGKGGKLTQTITLPEIPIPFVGVKITLEPLIIGGDGGEFGKNATQGSFDLKIKLDIKVGPIGPIPAFNVPVNIPVELPVPTPSSGKGGFAIKTNGKQINIDDGTYDEFILKGKVGL